MTAHKEIRNHLWPTAEQTVPHGNNQLTSIVMDNLTVCTTYRVTIYVYVDNPTKGASC